MTEPITALTGPDLEQAIGYDAGFTAGWHAALAYANGQETRDDRLARSIVAYLIQHDYNQQLVASIARTKPYSTPTGINWREKIGGSP